MDFINWCTLVLNRLIEANQNDPNAWFVGISIDDVCRHFFNCSIYTLGDDPKRKALNDATRELLQLGFLLPKDKHGAHLSVTQQGIEATDDLIPTWEYICSKKLSPEQQEFLKVINSLSENIETDFAWLEHPKTAHILSVLGWTDSSRMYSVGKPLEENLGFVIDYPFMTREYGFRATYPGLVWTSRRGITLESKRIDALVRVWETTSVDFKRELSLDTADNKAEFVKDILGLVNTQSSPPRLLIIGFDDKTRNFHSPPDPRITQDRIEQILRDLTSPMVNVRFERIEYRSGIVGQIEVIRESKKLPYRVRDGCGFKGKGGYRVEKDQIFVRHGSQTEEPTPEELKSIIAEGNSARSLP
jgi:hypothetical protein